jgi:response regulator RpfG family c-di-GMP phosphodiesterase
MMSTNKKSTLLLIDDKPANLILKACCLKTKTVKLLRAYLRVKDYKYY